MAHDYDVIVAGAGMVGAAAAYGLAAQGSRVLLLDGADTDYRAAKANFGLVWLQGKGHGYPAYQRLSREAVQAWPEFARQLQEDSGIALDYECRGGLHFCLSDDELASRAQRIGNWHRQAPEAPACTHILDLSLIHI